MRRRDVSIALLATATSPVLAGCVSGEDAPHQSARQETASRSAVRGGESRPAAVASPAPAELPTPAEVAAGVRPANPAVPSHLASGVAFVERYGAVGDGVTNDSTAFETAKKVALQAQCPIGLMAKTYIATVSIHGNNTGIVGPGSSTCTIRNPPDSLSTGGVVEVGDTAAGNAANPYEHFIARGFTIDGNRSRCPSPSDDVHGHGMILTSVSNYRISDVCAINCHNAGIALVINSNYGYVDCSVENCGNKDYTAVGFDVNSSKYLNLNVACRDCPLGGVRVLDNCAGIIANFTIYNASTIGFIYQNQVVNESHDNTFTVLVDGGGLYAGAQIGNNCRNSHLCISVSGVTGVGVQEIAYPDAAHRPAANTYLVNTKGCGLQSAIIGGDGGTWNVTSYQDGRAGTAGSVYAIQVQGCRNNVTANITDSATPQVRGMCMTAESSGNLLLAFNRNRLVSDWQDLGSGNIYSPRQLRASKGCTPPVIAPRGRLELRIEVPGATPGSGDMAQVQCSQPVEGIALYAQITSADTVTAWLTNQTDSPIQPPPLTINALVTKSTP